MLSEQQGNSKSFERFVDPDTINPEVQFFKHIHHTYVRKNMKAKKDQSPFRKVKIE